MEKMEKIVITGGIGYIGTELCKLYSGEARYKKIIVIDNRFISERVKQLTDWGIEFIHGSILDENLISQVLENCDIVYHLAGVTDVAYTKIQSNSEKDNQIRENGVTATNYILKHLPDNCKIIFPSTHVVYEGFNETKFNITEDEPTNPVLTYSTGKAQSENDIKESGCNYIILRLGSVYGYSTDTMRINIMPNLFSKISSQNGIISLFSGGIQHKSLISVIDVARAMMMFGKDESYNKQTYHLSNENMTIKEVSEICKGVNPKVQIITTDDLIPNLGYTLSNKKLLSTGFTFLYDIKSSIKEMIQNWSSKTQPDELEYIIKGSKDYVDERGKISNYELTEPINLIGWIESKAGTVRANHYHPIQEQKCLLIKGKYISVTKDLSDQAVSMDSPIETRIIKSGEIAVIRPNVAHTMVFLEDSLFLNLVRGEREHENYGITHTIPYRLVDDKFKNDLINNYKTNCRSCNNDDLKDILSLGMSPLANNLKDNMSDVVNMYPLEIKYCPKCHNVQLSYVVPPSEMFDNYLYVSSTAKSFRTHFEEAAIKYIDEFKLDNKSFVVDIGSNDGVFLKPLKERGVNVIGVEPAANICEIANRNGIDTIHGFFNQEALVEILKRKNNRFFADYIIGDINDDLKVDLVTASNVFAHSDELVNITKNAFRILKNGGSFIVEVQYLLDTIKDMTFDNIYHEHVNYWCVTSLNNFFNELNLTLYKVEHIDTHGGSIRVYVGRNFTIDESVNFFLKRELDFGLTNYQTYKDFSKKLSKIRSNVHRNIQDLKSKFKTIAGYGSPAKATTSLNYFGIDTKFIDYTIEDNQLKYHLKILLYLVLDLVNDNNHLRAQKRK